MAYWQAITSWPCSKNIIHLKAKQSMNVLQPETFGLELALSLLDTYSHLSKVLVDITQLRWSRMVVDGELHPHSFIRDGDDQRVTSVVVDATNRCCPVATMTSGVVNWLVLKTTGSSFEGVSKGRVHHDRR